MLYIIIMYEIVCELTCVCIVEKCTVSKDAVKLSAQPRDIISMVRDAASSSALEKVSAQNIVNARLARILDNCVSIIQVICGLFSYVGSCTVRKTFYVKLFTYCTGS